MANSTNFKEPEGQLARWLERLEEYDFSVIHRRGSQHSNADALSRGPCKQCGRSSHFHNGGAEVAVTGAVTDMHFQTCSTEEMRHLQSQDPITGPVYNTVRDGRQPSPDELSVLGRERKGSKYVLVACFTKWVEAYGIPNQEAVNVAVKLVDEMFCHFSPPEQVHSDQGRQFESILLKEVCNLLQIRKTHTTPYRPQGNGMVERFNRTLLDMLATAVGITRLIGGYISPFLEEDARSSTQWKGPFIVVEKKGSSTYKIKDRIGGKFQIVHFDRLKPCMKTSALNDGTSSSPKSNNSSGLSQQPQVMARPDTPHGGEDMLLSDDEDGGQDHDAPEIIYRLSLDEKYIDYLWTR
ncbi:hypothetical protein EMCRGX_G007400 [Ephydatia muelleri]